jgi:hypothetical protein
MYISDSIRAVIRTCPLQNKIMLNTAALLYIVTICTCVAVPLEQSLTIIDASSCPAGFFCVSDDRTRSVTPQACPPGTYSGIGASSCTTCRNGYWTIRYASSYCDICPIGHSCLVPSSVPRPCPLGTANPALAQTSCFPCEDGEYTPGLQSPACAACPHGQYCTDAAEQPKPCPSGKYNFTKNVFS